HGHLTMNQIGGHRRQSINSALRPAIFDRHVAAFDVAGFLQGLTECSRHWLVSGRRLGVEKSDHRHRRLLRARRERPRDGRAAEQRDELAALHSITSSAVASSVDGTERPSALAVFAFIANMYFVGI